MQIDGQMALVPFDATGLEQIARIADGRYYPLTDEEGLKRVYRELSRIIGWEHTRMEVSFLLLGLAGVFLLTGGGLSMAWFRRVP
jgi:Ca-activated chloride channel family protein